MRTRFPWRKLYGRRRNCLRMASRGSRACRASLLAHHQGGATATARRHGSRGPTGRPPPALLAEGVARIFGGNYEAASLAAHAVTAKGMYLDIGGHVGYMALAATV